MFTKPAKTDAHKRLGILQKRKTFSVARQKKLERLNSGHEGESRFFHLLQTQLECEPIQLYNLHLKVAGSECQIDCLLIFQNEIILFELKNYHGDFLIDNNKWFKLPKREIKNPLHQLQRTELLFKQTLDENNISLALKSYLVFVNPEFHLYQTPINLPLICPAQLSRFIKKLKNIPSERHQRHHKIAQELKQKHINKSAYESNPAYVYHDLRKGVTCRKCNGLMTVYNTKLMRCSRCECLDPLEQSILRNIKDFSMLFPDQKITVKGISDWLGHVVTSYRLRAILSNHFQIAGKGRNTYYF